MKLDRHHRRRPLLQLGLTLPLAMAWQAVAQQSQVNGVDQGATRSETHMQLLKFEQRCAAQAVAWAAVGEMARLNTVLNRGLDEGWTINAAKEVLIQVYAYAGFPRSLNALSELMAVVNERRQRGMHDESGAEAGVVPDGAELWALGSANQTRLAGAPVQGPLFDFAPAIDQFLKQHLFGALFARDNLDWQSREIATVSMLAAMTGVQSQLQSHVRISLNTGLTLEQLTELGQLLAEQISAEAGARVLSAIRQMEAKPA